jgi:hypothetical protein
MNIKDDCIVMIHSPKEKKERYKINQVIQKTEKRKIESISIMEKKMAKNRLFPASSEIFLQLIGNKA